MPNVEEIIHGVESRGLPLVGDVVAVVLMKNENIHHAGLVINHDGQTKFIDYTSREVRLCDSETATWPDYQYCKVLDYIDESEVGLYKEFCECIWERNMPQTVLQYGFLLTPYTFTHGGDFDPTANVPPVMTCVGFVLNILNYFLIPSGKSFIDIATYPNVEPEQAHYLSTFEALEHFDSARAPHLAQWIIRVPPVSLYSAAYINQHNRKKTQIDKVQQVVVQFL